MYQIVCKTVKKMEIKYEGRGTFKESLVPSHHQLARLRLMMHRVLWRQSQQSQQIEWLLLDSLLLERLDGQSRLCELAETDMY